MAVAGAVLPTPDSVPVAVPSTHRPGHSGHSVGCRSEANGKPVLTCKCAIVLNHEVTAKPSPPLGNSHEAFALSVGLANRLGGFLGLASVVSMLGIGRDEAGQWD